MSYLNPVRLSFKGKFQAAPSTVNNDPNHFNNATFDRKTDWAQKPGAQGGWWNPMGDASWRLIGRSVSSAWMGADQPVPSTDPVLSYRFSEIVHGRKLIAQAGDPGFAYAGDVIAFDPAGVYPVITNPGLTPYTAGKREALLNGTFNYTYTNLLKSLHRMFNGEPSLLGASIGIMESLKTQAFDLMSTQIAEGKNAGPTFEYQPVPAFL